MYYVPRSPRAITECKLTKMTENKALNEEDEAYGEFEMFINDYHAGLGFLDTFLYSVLLMNQNHLPRNCR